MENVLLDMFSRACPLVTLQSQHARVKLARFDPIHMRFPGTTQRHASHDRDTAMNQPVINHPIIRSLTDTDVYTFSVCYLYLKQFPRAWGRYEFTDRDNAVYPFGFADAVREQIKAMENIRITDEEIEYMLQRCYYLPVWFYTFLRGYRFDSSEVNVWQDAEGHLHITIEGLLWKVIFWEIPLLAIVSELQHAMAGHRTRYDRQHEYEKSMRKCARLLENGLLFADFGTRRRFSFDHQEMVVQSLVEASRLYAKESGKCVGTSNMYLAMKYNLTPIGTMSHQFISFCGAIFGYKEANFLAMDYWQNTFDSDLGIFLYDTFGWNAFQQNFSRRHAKLFDGLRVDSGDNFTALDRILEKYEELNVDPRAKQITFSNGLNVEEAIAIHEYCKGKIRDNYGIGTFLTCDVTGVRPMNIVIKLTAAKLTEKKPWQKAIKLSDDPGKYTGDPEEVAVAKKMLGLP